MIGDALNALSDLSGTVTLIVIAGLILYEGARRLFHVLR